MKINKFRSKQILKLHLLNSKMYECATKNGSSGFITDFNLTKVISDFKKALDVIFEYHQASKKILFVGLPKNLELKINRLTHHVAVNRDFELQSLLTNSSRSLKFPKTENQLPSKANLKPFASKFLQKPDLVVLLAHEKKQNIIVEKNLTKIPLIVFSSENNFRISSPSSFYNIAGFNENLISTSEKSLLFLGLNFLFKRFKKGN